MYSEQKLMLASLGKPEDLDEMEASGEWCLEEKWDGERILVMKRGNTVRAFSRNWKEVTAKIPEIVASTKKLLVSNMDIDGEIVHIDESKSIEECFSLSASRMRMKKATPEAVEKIPLTFIAFDTPTNPYDYNLPQNIISNLERKEILRIIIKRTSMKTIVVSKHHRDNFKDRYEQMIAEGKEGCVMKRIDGLYERKRSKNWLKMIPSYTLDVIATGVTEGKGKFAEYFGAFECETEDGLSHKAGVGNLTQKEMGEIKAMLDSGELEFPFMVEISLKGYYPSGTPRQPRVKRIRPDKELSERKEEVKTQRKLGDY